MTLFKFSFIYQINIHNPESPKKCNILRTQISKHDLRLTEGAALLVGTSDAVPDAIADELLRDAPAVGALEVLHATRPGHGDSW